MAPGPRLVDFSGTVVNGTVEINVGNPRLGTGCLSADSPRWDMVSTERKKKFEDLLVLRTLTCRSTWRLVGPTVNPVWDTLTGAAELRIDPKSGCCVFMYLGPRRNFSKSRLCCFPNSDSCFSIPAIS